VTSHGMTKEQLWSLDSMTSHGMTKEQLWSLDSVTSHGMTGDGSGQNAPFVRGTGSCGFA